MAHDPWPGSAASIPYEGADCTPEEAVEAVKAVRASAARFAEGLRRLARVGWTTACFTGRHADCAQRPGCGCKCHMKEVKP